MKTKREIKILRYIIKNLAIKELERYKNGQVSENCEEIYEDLEKDINQLSRMTRLGRLDSRQTEEENNEQ